MKILKVKIRVLAALNNQRVSGARQQVDISIKWKWIKGQQENWSTDAHIKRKKEREEEKRYFYAVKEV